MQWTIQCSVPQPPLASPSKVSPESVAMSLRHAPERILFSIRSNSIVNVTQLAGADYCECTAAAAEAAAASCTDPYALDGKYGAGGCCCTWAPRSRLPAGRVEALPIGSTDRPSASDRLWCTKGAAADASHSELGTWKWNLVPGATPGGICTLIERPFGVCTPMVEPAETPGGQVISSTCIKGACSPL